MSEHSQHHDDPMSHVPPPSFWPVVVAAALGLAMFALLGLLGLFDAGAMVGPWWEQAFYPLWKVFATAPLILVGLGGLLLCFALMGWGHQIIAEKPLSHDLSAQQRDLKKFTLYLFVSEGMAFGAIFGYLYIRGLFSAKDFVRPEEIHLGGPLIAIATILLLSSSVTCEFAHHFLQHGRKTAARVLLLTTIVLGTIFLAFQGFEYGELIVKGFTPKALGESEYNAFAALFYISTGFHGVHVATGLIMLFIVWLRMELGHFSPERHFAMIAASWYWHFVDIVWILLFTSVYVLLA